MAPLISRIVVDERVQDEPLTRRILERRGSAAFDVTDDASMQERMRSLTLERGKRILYITRLDGGFVKPCPATRAPYLCCRYTVINQAAQCPLDCTYCILQDYLNSPVVTAYANLDAMYEEIDALLDEQPNRFFRFGTGELTDSLALDEMTGLSRDLSRFFADKGNAILELKSKTVRIGELSACAPGRIVVSWSLNPPAVVRGEEFRAASIEDRLAAARRCMDMGFLLGFHFDPILSVDGFEDRYRELVEKVFRYIDGARIAWISLGSLRFPPSLKETIRNRFPGTRILHEEMVRGLDGKLRYVRPLRVSMYRKVYDWLKEQDPDLFLYFCMEPPWVWEAVMGEAPTSNADLDYRFARSLYERFPELGAAEPRPEAYE